MNQVYQDGVLGYPAMSGDPSGIGGLGATVRAVGAEPATASAAVRSLYPTLAFIGMACSVYHGYKRTQSVGWTAAWAMFGAVAPIVALPVALAQGFGERSR